MIPRKNSSRTAFPPDGKARGDQMQNSLQFVSPWRASFIVPPRGRNLTSRYHTRIDKIMGGDMVVD